MKNLNTLSLLLTAFTLLIQTQAQAQAQEKRFTSNELNTDFANSIHIESLVGASANLAFGKYIDYHRSFHQVNERNTSVDASILPNFAPVIGVQVRHEIFKDKPLSKLGISLGIKYQQRGFTNKFNSVHSFSTNFEDETEYIEKYRLHYLIIPANITWGERWFGNLGASYYRFFSGTNVQEISRSQTGADSFNNGFTTKDKEASKLTKDEIKSKGLLLTVGGGYRFGAYSMSINADITGKTLTRYQTNFKNLNFQLLLSKIIYN